jgi:peptidoglycan-associated lipoprotein
MKNKSVYLCLLFYLIVNTSCSVKTTKILKNVDTTVKQNKTKQEIKLPQEPMFLQEVFFDFNSFEIVNIQDEHNLKLIKRYLLQNKNKKLLLVGYCDERGSDEYNIDLGLKRAEKVKQTLIDFGIDQDRIQTNSVGKVAGNSEEEQRLNRKVVINIVGDVDEM